MSDIEMKVDLRRQSPPLELLVCRGATGTIRGEFGKLNMTFIFPTGSQRHANQYCRPQRTSSPFPNSHFPPCSTTIIPLGITQHKQNPSHKNEREIDIVTVLRDRPPIDNHMYIWSNTTIQMSRPAFGRDGQFPEQFPLSIPDAGLSVIDRAVRLVSA